jgi:hypothetical protein
MLHIQLTSAALRDWGYFVLINPQKRIQHRFRKSLGAFIMVTLGKGLLMSSRIYNHLEITIGMELTLRCVRGLNLASCLTEKVFLKPQLEPSDIVVRCPILQVPDRPSATNLDRCKHKFQCADLIQDF